jgi:hypothetical protein
MDEGSGTVVAALWREGFDAKPRQAVRFGRLTALARMASARFVTAIAYVDRDFAGAAAASIEG